MDKNQLTKLEKYWILYDIGNSAFVLLVSTIIPIYFKNIASANGISLSDSTAYYGYAVSLSTLIVAVIGPVLGTIADTKGYKKPLFTFSMMVGVIGCAALALPSSWIFFLAVFVVAKVGFASSLIFYDAMLSDVTTDDRMDNLSSLGYAWGYLGSCVPFIASLILVLFAEPIGLSTAAATAIAFLLNAVWWLVVTLPLLKNYKQIYYIEPVRSPIKSSFQRFGNIFKELRENKTVFYFLLAFFFYIDGVYTIIEMATSYGKDVGIDDSSLLLALLLTQIVAFPFSILFGKLTKKYRTTDLISISIVGYIGIVAFALQLDKTWEFWFLAVLVAVFQGAIQALSRSHFARIIPKNKSSEYFGIYDIFGKGASFLGTMLMGITTQLADNSKVGVAVIGGMLVLGFMIFHFKCRNVETKYSESVS